jgi:uncharacterized protein DUF1844
MTEREETNYRVTDRRKYNPDGTPREGAEPSSPALDELQAEAQVPLREQAPGNVISFPGEAASKQPQPVAASPQATAGASEARAAAPAATSGPAVGQVEQAYNNARGPQSTRLPAASFLSLANMLAVEAAMHLGLIQAPGEEAPPVDLEAARHLIDMLGMLQAKTRGNLTREEEDLLEKILADLRMQFVAISKKR